MKRFSSYLFLCFFFFSPFAEAKLFSNQFIEFQLPERWKCQLDGSEWVCQSTDEEKKRDAIIVLAAKIRKPGMDELDVYRKHLENKQQYQAPNGQKVISEPRYVKDIQVNGKTWIDSLHLQSEIPDFFTRYLATVEADLGVLITFSVRKDKYTEYAPDIDAMVKSLRVFRKPGAINSAGGDLDVELEEELGDINPFPDEQPCPKGQKRSRKTLKCVTPKKKSGGDDDIFFLIAVIAALGVGFIVWKKKRQG